jgi:ABC-type molybdate transport system ATPase subunit
VREREGSAFAEVLIDLGPHRILARITRLSLHDLGLVAGSPVFALLKSVSLSKHRGNG